MKTAKIQKKMSKIERDLRQCSRAVLHGLLSIGVSNLGIKEEISFIQDWADVSDPAVYETYAALVRDVFEDIEGISIKGLTVQDANHSVIEFLPLPGPVLEVTENGEMYRFHVFWLAGRYTLQTILKRIHGFDDEIVFQSIDLCKADSKIIKLMRKTMMPVLAQYPQRLDLIDRSAKYRAINAARAGKIDIKRAAWTMRSLTLAEAFVLIASVISTLNNCLQDYEKPYFLWMMEINSNGNKEEKEEKEENFRGRLQEIEEFAALLNFNHPPEISPVFPAVFSLNDKKTAKMVMRMSGSTAVVHCEEKAPFREIAREMEAARISRLNGLPARYPLKSCPIFVGKKLPRTVSWIAEWEIPSTNGEIQTGDIRRLLGALYRNEDELLAAFRRRYVKIGESSVYTQTAYFEAWAEAIDEVLAVGEDGLSSTIVKDTARQVELHDKIRRLEEAVERIANYASYRHLIAPSSKELDEDCVGFWYQRKDGSRKLAFAHSDFQNFVVDVLGLDKSDEPEFRQQLRDRWHLITEPELTTTIVGKGRKNAAHVLIDVDACDNLRARRSNMNAQ